MARVVLAMSGGVDSSVAAHLLLEQGHEVIGVFMRHGQQSPAACDGKAEGGGRKAEGLVSRAVSAPASSQNNNATRAGGGTPRLALPIVERLDHKQGCCTSADAEDARRVADRLGIPFYALNLDAEFGQIIDYFVAEYAAGRTPNPCVQCNNWIKFGKLFEYADGVDAEFVATGHYARIGARGQGTGVREEGPVLLRGRDAAKDQSYVLFGIERRFLNRMLLPVGEFEKPAIRTMAAELGMDVAAKKDSQEICFVTRGRYDEFVKRQRGGVDSAGEYVLTTGEVVGRHAGVEGFTVGQRKGLGIALGEPKFVVRIEAKSKRVVLGSRDELARRELTATDCNWLIDAAELPRRGRVQIRYNAAPADASLELDRNGRLRVVFDEPQFGVAPGQAAVCYSGERVLGGGWIA